MRKIKYFITLIGLLFFLVECGEAEKPMDNKGNIEALREIKTELKVKEAFINDANVLYVSVDDDGTSRNGYAQYLCQILKDKQASCSYVKIVKVNSLNDPNSDNAFGVILGESNCN